MADNITTEEMVRQIWVHLGLDRQAQIPPIENMTPKAESDVWLTATEIGERLGKNPNTVSKTAKRKGFRRHPDNYRLICLADAKRQWG